MYCENGSPPAYGRKHNARCKQRVNVAEAISATLVVAQNKAHLHMGQGGGGSVSK